MVLWHLPAIILPDKERAPVQPETEDDMAGNVEHPDLFGVGPFRGGNARSHAGLEQKPSGSHGECGSQCRRRRPIRAREHQEGTGIAYPDDIVPNPADRMLERIGTRERDVVVKDTGIGQVAEPASHQPPVRRGHLKEPLQEQSPEIEQRRCANSDEDCAARILS
jgi:hypothetical protein